MGVTITVDLPEGQSWILAGDSGFGDLDWCLCAQLAPEPHVLVHTEHGRYVLRLFAEADCPDCGGSGVHRNPAAHAPQVNWSDVNAATMFGLLGYSHMHGSASLPDMRRAVIRARRRVKPELERPAERLQSGSGLAFRVEGLDVAGMLERLDALDAVLAEGAAFGAATVSWS